MSAENFDFPEPENHDDRFEPGDADAAAELYGAHADSLADDDAAMLNNDSIDTSDETTAEDTAFADIIAGEFEDGMTDHLFAEVDDGAEVTEDTKKNIWDDGIKLAKQGWRIPPNSPLPGAGMYLESRGYTPPIGEHEYDTEASGPDWDVEQQRWREYYINLVYDPADLEGGVEELNIEVHTGFPGSSAHRERMSYYVSRAPDGSIDIEKKQTTSHMRDIYAEYDEATADDSTASDSASDAEALEKLDEAMAQASAAEAVAREMGLMTVTEKEVQRVIKMLKVAYKRD